MKPNYTRSQVRPKLLFWILYMIKFFSGIKSHPLLLRDAFDAKIALNKIHFDIDDAFGRFISEELDCLPGRNCKIDPSSLELRNLPSCTDVVGSPRTGDEWYRIIQSNYQSMHTYQYYLSEHFHASASKAISEDIKKDLRIETKLYAVFARLIRSDVNQRTCNQLVESIISEPIRSLPSQVLETARSYQFLRQYSEFLMCFKHTYEQFTAFRPRILCD
nr:uncharacterized protein LOC120325437 [Styela clava]